MRKFIVYFSFLAVSLPATLYFFSDDPPDVNWTTAGLLFVGALLITIIWIIDDRMRDLLDRWSSERAKRRSEKKN
jgi:hypothetical protein